MTTLNASKPTSSKQPRDAHYHWFTLTVLAVSGCHREPAMPHDARSGGNATVFDTTRDAFSLPLPGLAEERQRAFFVGNSLFNQNWVGAPSSVASRDGLGPLFNARSCSGCHFKDGRGHPPASGETFSSALLRISVAGKQGPHGAPVGDPTYGDQIQGNALPGVPKEADVYVDYTPSYGAFANGDAYELTVPHYRIEELGYGPLAPRLLFSPRVAPAMIGLGLLEAIPEATLLQWADPLDADHDGISGRVNLVPEIGSDRLILGRFGWKAEQPNVAQQVAAAFQGDMGLSTTLFPSHNHSERQTAALDLPTGGEPEVAPELLRAVTAYSRMLAVPARRDHEAPAVMRGEDLFSTAGCSACHVPSVQIEASLDVPELGHGEIHPYSDLLLHDLGPELSDNRPSFQAQGNEWRTPPLWGIGLVRKVNSHTRFMHDGRARNLQEAILWHGGEASPARERFLKFSPTERGELIAFLDSL
jgi:CxxC motif-containing protein (DUF1111 family)